MFHRNTAGNGPEKNIVEKVTIHLALIVFSEEKTLIFHSSKGFWKQVIVFLPFAKLELMQVRTPQNSTSEQL